jgi:hypothetical protein
MRIDHSKDPMYDPSTPCKESSTIIIDRLDSHPGLSTQEVSDVSDLIKKLRSDYATVVKPVEDTTPEDYDRLMLDFKRLTAKRSMEIVSNTDDGFIYRIERYGEEEPIFELGSDFVYKDPVSLRYFIGKIQEIWQSEKYVDYTIGELEKANVEGAYVRMF